MTSQSNFTQHNLEGKPGKQSELLIINFQYKVIIHFFLNANVEGCQVWRTQTHSARSARRNQLGHNSKGKKMNFTHHDSTVQTEIAQRHCCVFTCTYTCGTPVLVISEHSDGD